MQPPKSPVRRLSLRFPSVTTLILTLIPSVFAATFNLLYNRQQIIGYLQGAEGTFDFIQTVINGVAFPVGIALTVYLAGRAVASIRQVRREPKAAETAVDDDGRSLLQLGHVMARLALTLWLVSGLAYPLSLHLLVPGSITWGVYIHFALSLALCGVLAGTYPFFFISFTVVQLFLPEMIRRQGMRSPQVDDIEWLRRMNRIYLVLTAFVPLLGILLILLSAQSAQASLQSARQWLIIASATGLIGFGLMYWLHRVIDEDLLALRSLSPEARRAGPASW